MRNRRTRKSWIVLLAALVVPAAASAFQVDTMKLSFAPSGGGAVRALAIENTTGARIAVQLEAFEKDSGKKAPFRIEPSQTSLFPGEKRNIRVEWTGPAKPEGATAFRIVVSELPVFREKNDRPKTTFLLQYVISATVRE